MARTNILHLRASNFYGGPERQIHMHALEAQKSEFNIIVSSFLEKGEAPEFLKVVAGDNLPTHVFEVSNSYDIKAPGLVRKYLRENDIRILCTHDYRSQVIGFLSTLGTPTRWIAFARGWTAENLKIRIYHAIDKLVIRFADRIVAVSGEQRRQLIRLLVPERKIVVAYNAIDPDKFRDRVKISLRQRFDFPGDSPICVSGGRFSSEKGQIYLVRAAEIALSKFNTLRFVLWGDGPDLPKIKNVVEKFGLEDKIICPGFEKNLLSCLADADMLINPSLSEGLPNIVLEAMALRVPVVATAVGGVPELINDGINGFLVKAGEAASMAEKILRLVGNKSLRDQFKNEGYQTILRNFSFTGQAEKLYAVYRSVW